MGCWACGGGITAAAAAAAGPKGFWVTGLEDDSFSFWALLLAKLGIRALSPQ